MSSKLPVPARSQGAVPLEQQEHNLFGGILNGVDGLRVQVQARYMGPDQPGDCWSIAITGMAGIAVREVVARCIGAFSRYGIPPKRGQILINLAPAGIPKIGTTLDLPIALICLQAAGYLPDLPPEYEQSLLLLGELGLHGELRRINGALPIALCAPPGARLIVPKGNEKECCMIRGLLGHGDTHVFVAETLEEVVGQLTGRLKLQNAMQNHPKYEGMIPSCPDFADIKGQERAKRALTIAAAGGHNVLLVGPPGEGKSLLASALPGILPPLSNPEKIELTKLYSAKGLLTEDGMVVSRRPFRAIHHSASKQSLVGGGSGIPQPGEITLAHKGVLFLDEMAEFSRATLESLRQPIESGSVTISRVDSTLSFPSRFSLVAAMNPCPCGYFGTFNCRRCQSLVFDRGRGCGSCGGFDIVDRCTCRGPQVQAYQKKVSGPILDRIDLQVPIRPLSIDERFSTEKAESTQSVRARVVRARNQQAARFESAAIGCNAEIPGGEVGRWCAMPADSMTAYKQAISTGSFTTRAMDRMAKVSRTIADLEDSEVIEPRHILEAAEFLGGTVLN